MCFLLLYSIIAVGSAQGANCLTCFLPADGGSLSRRVSWDGPEQSQPSSSNQAGTPPEAIGRGTNSQKATSSSSTGTANLANTCFSRLPFPTRSSLTAWPFWLQLCGRHHLPAHSCCELTETSVSLSLSSPQAPGHFPATPGRSCLQHAQLTLAQRAFLPCSCLLLPDSWRRMVHLLPLQIPCGHAIRTCARCSISHHSAWHHPAAIRCCPSAAAEGASL